MPGTVRTTQTDEYWLHAKRDGWGWGLPKRWMVLVTFIVLFSVAPFFVPPTTPMSSYLAAVGCLCAALIAVCWRTSEPPHWRWGDREFGDANSGANSCTLFQGHAPVMVGQ